MEYPGGEKQDHSPPRIWVPLYLAVGYLAAGLFWILASDHLLAWISTSDRVYQALQTYKGIAFILITALGLFLVANRYFAATISALRAQYSLATQVHRDQAIRDAVFENLEEGLCISDSHGRAVLTNAAVRRICNLGRGEEISAAHEGFQFFESDGVTPLPYAEFPTFRAQRGEVVELEQLFMRSEGFPDGIWLFLSARPVRMDPGTPPYVVTVIRDITALKQAEQALRDTEHSLALLLGNLPGMAFRDAPNGEGDLSFASAGCQELTGYQPEDFAAGRIRYRGLIGKEDIEDVRAALRRACANHAAYMVSYRITTAAGERKWVMEQGMPLYGPDGRCVAIEGFAGDVTAQRTAEIRLQEREAYYRALIENLEDIVVEVAPTGELLYSSPAVERVLGYPPDQVIGTQLISYVHPDDLRHVVMQARRIIRDLAMNLTLEFRVRHAAGAWRILEGRGRLAPGKGTLIFNARDVTARRQAEEERQLLALALEQTTEALAFVTANGKVRYFNRAFGRMFDLQDEPGEERLVRDLLAIRFDGDQVAPSGSAEHFWEALNSNAAWSGRAVSNGHGSECTTLNLALSPVRAENGATLGSLLLLADVSERVRLEDQMRRMQRLESIGTLAGGIAHDFNNILAAIIGYTELANGMLDTVHPARKMLGEVLSAGQRARDLVHQILTFSRQHDQQKTPLRLHTVVREAVHLLRATLPSSVYLDERIATDCPPVLADPTQIHQVVMNLCTNAYQALHESGGRITVELDSTHVDTEMSKGYLDLPPGIYIRLSVRDTGSGMPAAVQARIFEPFYTTKEKGTGLGLSTVHGIVRSHDGTISVYSEPGVGSVFNVYLPTVEQSASSDVLDTQDYPQGNGERILLVDDEEALAHVGERILTHLGYQVTACTSSGEAYRIFCATPDNFDLLLTDMQMPDMTGTVLLGKLRKIRPSLPVIISTGFSDTLTQQRIRDLRLSAVILKPVITRELAIAVRSALEPKPDQ